MKLLGIDTALNACSVAIVDGNAVLACVVSAGGKGNAERLLPLLEQARLQAGIELAQLDGIAATIGPGSFTGIRTALATARALGLALKIPVWGITTTETLAHAAILATAQPGLATVAVIDAKRDELYIQCYSADGAALAEPQLLNIADAAGILPPGPAVLVGSGSELLMHAARTLSGRDDLRLSSVSPDPDPVLVARIAAGRPRPTVSPSPLYIRPPDAKLPSAIGATATSRPPLNIQPCGSEAAGVLAALHAEAFTGQSEELWTEKSLRELLAMPGALALLATQGGGQPIGFILLRQAADEAEIITLAVQPQLRRLGVARRLLTVGLAKMTGRGAQQCFLEVADTNVAARGLYAAAGFVEVGRRPGYYRDATGGQRDAILMRR
ncbi:tRNA (adenosine(37)-N6)-threonylcarbamoyltransferase complex dimerization subunit type 1 TsaB [Ferrovibrio terrae]|uniref:tRNA (Adenosine(37)-N6)-threonylcarbamoyltransferase complex dimerization subunit type 1 TsaB n=1 Tax=Ferrovibrio terrae TaxID=2594003 RepID=A0A516H0C7_9PROT|nr:tRNA (adenosine(37)-N6)-threonylcarbamoyltransferase complex dimerization subunit type 1 TsaB [Ferrovibrio terrae]QDO97223.1 tRNA (adenosine(37)-N6)-threonylcarbamoyltransferase complex dimerization subunit type 1 TsaB [Ferrovibrio terrae]